MQLADQSGMRVFATRRARRAAAIVCALLSLAVALGVAIVAETAKILRSRQICGWVNDRPEKLFLTYETASTRWPGRLRVTGLRLRGRDPNVEWELRIRDCRLSVSLPSLLRREFHATSVEASGLGFRIRRRLTEEDARSAAAADLPSIEGFEAVPRRGHPEISPTPAGEPLWRVEIDGLDAFPVKELWFDSYRYAGEAKLTGRFSLLPRQMASVGPARLEWNEGELHIFGKPAIEPMRARLDCRIDSFDPERVRGSAVWDRVTASADWSGNLRSIAFLNALVGESPELSRGSGTASGLLRLDSGRGELRSKLSARDAVARYPGATLRGEVSAELRMSPWRPATGVAEIGGTFLDLRNVSSSGGSREWWGRFDTASGKLSSPGPGLRMESRVESRCRDARPLYTLFGVGLPKWTRGLLSLDGFSGRAGLLFGVGELRVQALEAAGGSFRVQGDYIRRGETRAGAFLVEDGPLRVGIELADGSTRLKLVGAEKWFRQKARL
jgi:hypothetical protein